MAPGIAIQVSSLGREANASTAKHVVARLCVADYRAGSPSNLPQSEETDRRWLAWTPAPVLRGKLQASTEPCTPTPAERYTPHDDPRRHISSAVRKLLISNAAVVGGAMERLLHGDTVEQRIDDDVTLQELHTHADHLWGLLLFSGYLTLVDVGPSDGSGMVRFRIPNREVRCIFADTFLYWLGTRADRDADDNLDALSTALLRGDEHTFKELLQRRLVPSLSYHDWAQGSLARHARRCLHWPGCPRGTKFSSARAASRIATCESQ